jgi:mycothiol synthase
MKSYPQEKLQVSLPEGFTVRGAQMEDVEPAMKLINAWSQSVIQQDESIDASAVRREWLSPSFDPAEDIRLIFAPDGELAGYIEVWTTAKPPVHPDYEGLGIGTWMLQWGEERAIQVLKDVPDDLRFAPHVGIWYQAERSKKLFEDMGYSYIRTSYHMRIEMDAPVSEPVWPQGITLRTFNPETDAEVVYRATQKHSVTTLGLLNHPLKRDSSALNTFRSITKDSTQRCGSWRWMETKSPGLTFADLITITTQISGGLVH